MQTWLLNHKVYNSPAKLVLFLPFFVSFVVSFASFSPSSPKLLVPSAKKGHKEKGDYECMYSGSGKVPLICASVAFVALAIAMLVQHSFLLIAISKTTPPVYVSWDPQSSIPMRSLTWQAGFFFISTWLCFAVGEIMLLIGLSVESGHLKDWSTPKTSCLIIRE
uniref:Uncharacterized protein n=1 Tax=Chenopodium quinoa TaxID=63459 RepID=A0A803NBW7_CHEQI